MDSPTLDLQAVRVRPVRPHEEPRWNVLMHTRHYHGGDKQGPETVYLITSLRPQQCGGELLIDLTRGYWAATENGCHRVRDHDCAEDKCRARKGNLPRSLALFANLALSLLRMADTRNIAEAMELNCYQPAQALALATP